MMEDTFGSMVVPVSRKIVAANDDTVIVPENCPTKNSAIGMNSPFVAANVAD